MAVELYSFDVFDTLITRTTATPKGVFAWMQREVCEKSCFADLPEWFRMNFFCLRIQGEKVARNTFINDMVKDITLDQIYQCMSCVYGLTETQKRKLMELEIEAECVNSIPILENIEKVKQLWAQKKRVVLITNMYLPESAIRRLLVQADPIFSSIRLYVSGELGKTKGTWTLYNYVRESEQVEFCNWKHLGDNKELDVVIPQRLNIQASWYETPEYLPWEDEFITRHENNLGLQLLLGASLRARNRREKSYSWIVGAGFSAPILYPYVEWILLESLRKGIHRLYFIARDGYILKEIADQVISAQGLAVETFYLYGSRKAWRLPSVRPERFDMEDFLQWNYPGQIYSYEGIASLFEMPVQKLDQFLSCNVKEGIFLSAVARQEVFQMLKANQWLIASYIQEHQKSKRERVIAYLRQEIKTADSSFAFVDLIGSGYTQKCLADLLSEWIPGEITTFFYRLDSCRTYEKNRNYAFYANRLKMGNVIEVLCGANHGQTVDYRQEKGRWEPVCETDEGQALDEYGFQDYRKGILDYARQMSLSVDWREKALMDLEIPGLYFDFMVRVRDPKLYQYIADIPYGIRGSQKEVKCFAPALSNRDLRQLYLFHKGEPVSLFYSGYSLEFSLLRLDARKKQKLEYYKRCSEWVIFRQLRKYMSKKQRVSRVEDKYDLIGNRIILYGAGKRGQLLYKQLTEGTRYHVEIVLWVDRNYEECKKNGLDVCGVDEILTCSDYDQVVIAVLKKEQANGMKEVLLGLEVPEYKILWICPDKRTEI